MGSLNGRHEAVIAVDAMGGDFAPEEVLKGAVQAHRRGIKVVIVGPVDTVERHLEALGERLPVVNAEDAVPMDEPVAQALRRRESSLQVAANLVLAGDADGVVSCGNSGAIMAITLTAWGRQPGIDRPAFGGNLPVRDGSAFVLDIGANTSSKASNLVQYAIMGDVYVRIARGVDNPRVALLSNGTEDSKGTKAVREANEALQKLDLNFIGNIEGNQVFEGAADVVVTDGFTGNVLLKGSEGVAMEMLRLIRNELSSDVVAKLAGAVMMPAFQRVRRRVDFEEYGGVPVLGVDGVMINCHGRSTAKAVTNAICLAERVVCENLVDQIGEALHHDGVERSNRRRRLARAFRLRHQ
ncbi:MAG TPA: phosphate acyltransferase PlsX [Chloroflexota bacterium]|nr:phosphate acyltransferase PlsX [Chloroflexota bacterium]